MTGIKNIIRKQTVHIQYNGQVDGFALQNEVGDWCANELMPMVEQQLEVLCRPGIHVALDTIEIGAIVPEANWKEQAQQQLLKAMNEQLYIMGVLSSDETFTGITALYGKPWTAGFDNSKGIASDQAERSRRQEVATKDTNSFGIYPASSGEEKEKVALGQKADELIIFFFIHGYLPWWSGTITTIGEFPQFFKQWVAAQKNKARVQNIVQQLQKAPNGPWIERMLNHLPGTLFFRFAKTCFPAAATELDNMTTFLSHLLDGGVNKPNQQQLLQPVYRYWLISSFNNVVPPSVPAILEILYNTIRTSHPEIISAAKEEVELVAAAGKTDITVAWWQLVMQKEGAARKQADEILLHSKEKGAAGHQPATGGLNVKAKATDDPEFSKIGKMPETVRQNTQEASKANVKAKGGREQKNNAMGQPPSLLTNEKPAITATPELRNSAMEKDLMEGVFIDNAGVVLVAVFLPALFAKLKIVQHGELIKPDTAVMLVQHIVTGKSGITEPELVLPKILCGLEPEVPVNTNKKITATQKREALSLLSSVIEHWAVLKNTSVQGLRETFFQRGGKLTLADNTWLLQVEQKPFDMLLQQLPWNINMIKLPWMTSLLKTEWI